MEDEVQCLFFSRSLLFLDRCAFFCVLDTVSLFLIMLMNASTYCQPEAEKIRVCGTVLGSVPKEGGVLTPGTGCGAVAWGECCFLPCSVWLLLLRKTERCVLSDWVKDR